MKAVVEVQEANSTYNVHPRKLKRKTRRKQRRQDRQALRDRDDFDEYSG
jgi:hypothetical protein